MSAWFMDASYSGIGWDQSFYDFFFSTIEKYVEFVLENQVYDTYALNSSQKRNVLSKKTAKGR